ncbi:MAG TPA: hypothetical protein VG758_34580 [Hyphomicrobiaceae bacterium]|jgi:hypothetical protein|nr:hypothetical protein [Hyphomicrobiaceae bacterium]
MASDHPEEHGRELAERLIAQATRYRLEPKDVGIMFEEDMSRHSRVMEAEGRSAEEIAAWVEAARRACMSRVQEERALPDSDQAL